MKEPVATLTNAAYVLSGVAIWGTDPFMGALVILLGISSALYHATLRPWAQTFDECMMYAVFLVLPALYLGTPFVPIATAAALLLSVYHREEWVDSHVLVPALVVCGLIAAYLNSQDWRSVVLLLCIYSGAALVRHEGEMFRLERKHVMHGILHGVWHIATAFAIYQQFILTTQ